ncbi:MAG: efflux RND transporter permease subunit [Hyphomicrobiaceae bacterium]|nr:efflux RND transporter permease subunit [Hyphomicrobiaceae bacterium]
MKVLIEAAFGRSRAVLAALVLVLVVGIVAYIRIAKEAAPDVPIPLIYVTVTYQGIAPGDSERLLVRPLETELQAIEGLEEMRSTAGEGYATVALEFTAGFNAEEALDDVREAVDRARAELPSGVDEPTVREVNVALFPVVTVILSGSVPERALNALAKGLQDRIEALPGVLEVEVGGKREQLLEVLIDPNALASYSISLGDLLQQVQRNNTLIAAGAIDTGAGRITLKVPGVIDNISDVRNLPVQIGGNRVVKLSEVAVVRRTFEDPTGYARIGGEAALALEVKKRIGANLLETVSSVRDVVQGARASWPQNVSVVFIQDQSNQVRTLLGDLENNAVTAVVLVMILIVATLGWRNAILVAVSIPASFLAGVTMLWALGYTLNIVVLFSLILALGMLVDGAIITTELADRRMAAGAGPREAYAGAAVRMAWPVITSVLTTLAVFLPLLFWPGVVGEFMKFMPITVILVLLASLLVGLIFVPVLGNAIASRASGSLEAEDIVERSEDISAVRGITRLYADAMRQILARPVLTLVASLVLLTGTVGAFVVLGKGTQFFPDIEPELVQIQIRARDNLSVDERDALVRRVESLVLREKGIEHVYARTIGLAGPGRLAEDVIGVIQLDLLEWDQRKPASQIIQSVREATAGVAGVQLEVSEQRQGPAQGKPVELRLRGGTQDELSRATQSVRVLMDRLGGFTDVEDTRPPPGIEMRLVVAREKAALYGADPTLVGQAAQFLTQGLLLAEYRPDDAEEEVEIRVRFPADARNLGRLEQLRVPTAAGSVPILNFTELQPSRKTGVIQRIDGQRVITIQADVAEGLLANQKIAELQGSLSRVALPEGITAAFAGQQEDQQQAMEFLAGAFAAALLLMFLVMLIQFNSFYQTLLVMSAIALSTIGVLLALLVTGRPFGIVMTGVGTIAVGGIVVHNNIVLIDTFNDLRSRGQGTFDAALRTSVLRARPVILTSVNDILGLAPLLFALNIDLINREMALGGPSTQWWIDLSIAIAGGLAFATFLTLVLTPSMLILGERTRRWWQRA